MPCYPDCASRHHYTKLFILFALLAGLFEVCTVHAQSIDVLPSNTPPPGYGDWDELPRPRLTLIGFDSEASEAGFVPNPDHGYGVKQVLEKVYVESDPLVRSVYEAIILQASTPIAGKGRNDLSNIYQARAFEALMTYILEKNGYSASNIFLSGFPGQAADHTHQAALNRLAELKGVDEAEIETRLRTLAEELRCVVCQNESLAESRASLAVDLRSEMRAMMRSGMSDEAVVDSLVDRYGDFILYRPPLKPATWLLWAGPLLILLVAGGVAVTAVRRRAGRSPEADVSAEDLAQAATLLREARTRPEDGRGTARLWGEERAERRDVCLQNAEHGEEGSRREDARG